MAFHEVEFPRGISFGSRGGPRRKTVIATSGSGFEARNSQWADSRREYNAGYGVKSLDQLYAVIDFFEERRGQLHGFRWYDKTDFKSCSPEQTVAFDDQVIGTGDGVERSFQLSKQYGSIYDPYTRTIRKPIAGTTVVGLGTSQQLSGWSVDNSTGIVTFDTAPGNGVTVTAGFEFNVPVRFNTDYLEVDIEAFMAGSIPDIPIIEVRI